MRRLIRDENGLTLIEILVSTVLMVIIAVMSYSAFLSISAMGSLTRDEQEAEREISGWVEQVTASVVSHQDLGTGATSWTALSNIMTPGTWPLSTRPNVSNLVAEYRVNPNVQLNSDSRYNFRRIDMHVIWDERR
jgi:prepilin-type N-terminal cleavage/methylation domain-containing protein